MKKEVGTVVVFMSIVLILNSIYVLADEELYNEWHYARDKFFVNGINYTVFFVTDSQIDLKYGEDESFINNASCIESGYLRICVNNLKIGHYNATLEKNFYQAEININQITSELKLTRTIVPTSFLIGEESEVEITIENIGSITAENVVFEDVFPSSLVFTYINNCFFKENTIFWKGSIPKGKSQQCSYKIKANSKTNYSSKAELRYNNGVNIKKLTSDEEKIEVPDYSLKITTSYNKIEIGESFDFKIILNNTNTKNDLTINTLKLTIPKDITILNKPVNVRKKSNIITWKTDLEKNTSKEFILTLKTEKSGIHKIDIDSIFTLNKIRKEINEMKEVNILVSNLIIGYTIEDTYLKDEKGEFTLRIKNPSEKYKFNNLEINIRSDFLNLSKEIKTLDKLEEMDPISIDFNAPTAAGIYPLNITITYNTIYNEKLKLNKQTNITVNETTITDTSEENESELIELGESEDLILLDIKTGEAQGMPFMVIIIIILFLIIDFFLVISIYKKRKKE